MVFQLTDKLAFPDPHYGDPDGLLAVGGDLSIDRLILAYSNGIFPWYAFREELIQWWCPMDRFVIFPDEIHISHSMRTLINKGKYEITFNEAFQDIIQTCGELRIEQEGAWLGTKMMEAYTPLHGAGNVPVQRILKEIGFENVYVVPEQEKPDGDFPTVDYPNPEDERAFKLALELAQKVNADVVLANDPDADRLGVYAKDSKTGEYHSFTGNMSGLLIAEYELSQKQERGEIPANGALIKTIVSSNLADAIAKEYNLKLVEVLTGFKYIGEQMRLFEQTGENTYMFGFEESYGCLVGTHARDKDGIAAVMALCEAAAYYKTKGYTLWDQMMNIYEKYGYYKELTVSVTKEGVSGADEIKQIMENIRQNPITQLGKYKVLKFRDYKQGTIKDLETGSVENTNLPTSNVLYFDLNNDAWCCVRPSGTEPKIKFYIGIKENNMEDAEKSLKELAEKVKTLGQ